MADKPTKARAEELRNQLSYHNYLYHVLNSPTISDYEYDLMMRELQALEAEHPELVTVDSPTQRVGGHPVERFVRVPHPTPILSLANAFDADEVRAWFERISKLEARVIETDFIAEPKLDGLTVVLHYENGVFTLGSTRGDGEYGEDITINLRTVRSLPLRIPVEPTGAPPQRLVVRGEAFIMRDAFEAMNRRLEEEGKRTYVNPRNAAAGALRQLDSTLTSTRPISLLCYSVVYSEQPIPESQWDVLLYLRKLGFPVAENVFHCRDLDQAIAVYEKLKVSRDELPYEVDGVVIKINALQLGVDLGIVGKDPRSAIAFKFPAQVVTTQLLDIGINVGRTGVITPYAILEPIEVGGVTVSQATLHNFDFVSGKDIRVGDRVMIKRAGDVIPYVMGPVVEARQGGEQQFALPKTCPSCGESLVRHSGEVAVYCVNASCPAQLVRNLEHFASRTAMDIEGLGIKIAKQLVEAKLIIDVADIYSLDMKDLLKLDGFAEKKAKNLLRAISESCGQSLAHLVNALGIRGVGEAVATDLAHNYRSMDALVATSQDELEGIDGVGPNTAITIVDWIAQPFNRQLLEKLRVAGVWPVEVEEIDGGAPQTLTNMTLVLTGRLPSLSRGEAKALIEQHGGKVIGSVSRRTDYLVAGEDSGSKLDRAIVLKVTVIDEEGLRSLVITGDVRERS